MATIFKIAFDGVSGDVPRDAFGRLLDAPSGAGTVTLTNTQSVFGGTSGQFAASARAEILGQQFAPGWFRTFTISGFVRLSNIAGAASAFFQFGPDNRLTQTGSFNCAITTAGAVGVNVQSSGGSISIQSPNSVMSINTWTHIAIVGNTTELRLYVGGVQQGSASRSTDLGFGPWLRLGFAWYAAASINGSSQTMFIDDFTISDSEDYTANFTPPTSPSANPPAAKAIFLTPLDNSRPSSYRPILLSPRINSNLTPLHGRGGTSGGGGGGGGGGPRAFGFVA